MEVLNVFVDSIINGVIVEMPRAAANTRSPTAKSRGPTRQPRRVRQRPVVAEFAVRSVRTSLVLAD